MTGKSFIRIFFGFVLLFGISHTTFSKCYADTKPKPTKLLFGSFGPSTECFAKVFEEWGKELEERTGGRYIVEMSYGSALGKPPEYYDLVAKGVCDIAFFLPPYVSGRFPMTELTLLPFVCPTSEIGSTAFWKLYTDGYLDKEYSDVKVLFLWTGAGLSIYTNKKPPLPLDSAKNLKIKSAGGLQKQILQALGYVPVFIPISEAYIAIEKGTINGLFANDIIFRPFKLHEVLNYATKPGLTTYPRAVVMNKRVYRKMPEDVRSIIDDMCERYVFKLANSEHIDCSEGLKLFTDNGGEIVHWSQDELKKAESRLQPIWTEWIDNKESAGLQAKKAVNEFYSVLKSEGVENPAIGYTVND
jgi:TRAP-type C4-dicarboxylate transport system substrate-binding protein